MIRLYNKALGLLKPHRDLIIPASKFAGTSHDILISLTCFRTSFCYAFDFLYLCHSFLVVYKYNCFIARIWSTALSLNAILPFYSIQKEYDRGHCCKPSTSYLYSTVRCWWSNSCKFKIRQNFGDPYFMIW